MAEQRPGRGRHLAAGPELAATPHFSAGRAASLLGLLGVYYVLAVFVYERWRSHHWYPPSGDEPHYLTVAYSLAYNHTAEVTRAYQHDVSAQTFPGLFPTPASLTPVTAHSHAGPHGLFSIHGVGLPSLLVPGLRLGGIDGAKLTMIAISGIAVGVIGYVALRRIASLPKAVATAAVLAIGMPLLPAAAQIFPDLPAGVVALTVVAALFLSATGVTGSPVAAGATGALVADAATESLVAGAAPDSDGVGSSGVAVRAAGRPLIVDGLLALMVAYEPWIHVKEALPAVIATVALAWTAWHAGGRRRAAGMVALVGLSLVGLLAYDSYSFGSLLPTYTAGNSVSGISQSLMVFFGLHVDGVQGMFVQAPILVFGLAGLIRGCLRRQLWAYVAAATYLAVMIPNATFTNIYGGGSFAGRFNWTAALILFVPAVDLLADLWVRHRVLVSVVLVAEALLQAVGFVRYAIDHYVLYSQILSGVPVAWARDYPTIWGRVGRVLPSYDASWVWRYLPDVLAPLVVALVVVLLLLAAIGASGRRPLGRGGRGGHGRGGEHSRRGLAGWRGAQVGLTVVTAGYLVAALVAPVPRPPLRVPAALLPHTEGQVQAQSVVATAPPDQPGFVTFGPPYFLGPGTYTVTFAVASAAAGSAADPVPAGATASTPTAAPGSSVAGWDVDANPGGLASLVEPSSVVASGAIADSAGRTENVVGQFTLTRRAPTWAVQVRTLLRQAGILRIDSVTVRPAVASGP